MYLGPMGTGLIVKFKKLDPGATIPKYQLKGDAGLDLTAISKVYDEVTDTLIFGTGLAVEIPAGHVGLLFPRSSIYKTRLSLSNAVGVVDSNFRGEIKAIFHTGSRPTRNYEVGDRIIQLLIMPYPHILVEESEALSETDRGTGGFGSTGK